MRGWGTSSPPLYCIQANLHNCQAAYYNVHNIGDGNNTVNNSKTIKPDLILVQEPYNPFGRLGVIKNDLSVYRGAHKTKVRSCIIVKKDLNSWKLTQFSDSDQVTICVRTGTHIICFCNIYMPHDMEMDLIIDKLDKVVNFCRTKNYRLIISADANSHHVAWGSSDINGRGERLLEYFLNNNLTINNIGNVPTFVTRSRQEVLDITVSDCRAALFVKNWKVRQEESYSDHKLISFHIDVETDRVEESFRNPKKTNWDHFSNCMRFTNWDRYESSHRVDDQCKILTKTIMDNFEDSTPISKKGGNIKNTWWNKDIAQARKEIDKVRKQINKCQNTEDKKKLHDHKSNLLTKYRNKIRAAQRKAWQNFTSEIKDCNHIAKILKFMKIDKTTEACTLKNTNGTYTTNPSETLSLLLNTHLGTNVDANLGPTCRLTDVDGTTEYKKFKSFLSIDIVERAINSFKPYKSPGPDGIYPIMLQKSFSYIGDKIRKLYLKSMKTGQIPTYWLRAKVVFIPKPGKKDYLDPKAYRPISLTSFLLKGMEKIVTWYLRGSSLKYSNMHLNQFAYKKNSSTETDLHELV